MDLAPGRSGLRSEVAKLIRNGAYILDVRMAFEAKKGIAPGATNISLLELNRRLGELPRDRTIVTYCQTGGRAGKARDILERNGFKVVNGGGYETIRKIVMSQAQQELKMPTTTLQGKTLSTVELNWKEVFYTNCGMVSASNVDQELGWCKTDFAAIGVDYAYLLSRRENDWYPHYIHNLDNLIRFGGLYPTIHVQADIRRTRLLGATPTYEGGCMLVRAKDRIYKMSHLKGKRIGLSKSLNTLKADWWRITEHYGILNMLMLNDMSIEDVEIVEFPDADDWYTDPKMRGPLNSATEFYMGRVDHKRTLITRPLETALLEGKVDAIYTHSKTWQHLQEDTGKIAAIEDLSRHPDWRLQANNEPAVITCSDVMAEQHPELVVTFLKAMIKVGRWANEHKHAAAVILDRQTYYRDVEDTYQNIKHIDMVPSLSPKNLAQIEIGKDFMLEHGYIKRDFDVHAWAAPEFLERRRRN